MKTELLSALERSFSSFPQLVAVPVSDAEIAAAEQRLGCSFGEPYRAFVRRFGAAIVGDLPVLGLAKAEAMGRDEWSVVDVTEWFRRERWPGVDAWWIVSVDGAGNPIGVDESGRVWVSDHDAGGVFLLAASFEAFLESKV